MTEPRYFKHLAPEYDNLHSLCIDTFIPHIPKSTIIAELRAIADMLEKASADVIFSSTPCLTFHLASMQDKNAAMYEFNTLRSIFNLSKTIPSKFSITVEQDGRYVIDVSIYASIDLITEKRERVGTITEHVIIGTDEVIDKGGE
jgi:hypothetical protein